MKYVVIFSDGIKAWSHTLEQARWTLKNSMDRDVTLTGKIYQLVEI